MTGATKSEIDFEFGIGLPTLGGEGADGADLGAVAREAEALGFGSLWVGDLITGDGTPALDATVAATCAATATEHVRIGFGVLALPLRPAAWMAAQVQALQHVSGNRVVLGVGAGGFPDAPFWRAVGVPVGERGRRTDAALRVLPELIAGKEVELDDQPTRPTVTLRPAAPVPPILVGGSSEAAIRRVVAHGDGWFPSQIAPSTLAAGVSTLRLLAADRGRASPTVYVGGLTIAADEGSLWAGRAARASFAQSLPGNHGISPEEAMAMVVGSPAEAAERIAAYLAAGADGIVISPSLGSRKDDWLRQCESAAEARALVVA